MKDATIAQRKSDWGVKGFWEMVLKLNIERKVEMAEMNPVEMNPVGEERVEQIFQSLSMKC